MLHNDDQIDAWNPPRLYGAPRGGTCCKSMWWCVRKECTVATHVPNSLHLRKRMSSNYAASLSLSYIYTRSSALDSISWSCVCSLGHRRTGFGRIRGGCRRGGLTFGSSQGSAAHSPCFCSSGTKQIQGIQPDSFAMFVELISRLQDFVAQDQGIKEFVRLTWWTKSILNRNDFDATGTIRARKEWLLIRGKGRKSEVRRCHKRLSLFLLLQYHQQACTIETSTMKMQVHSST